MKKYDVAKFEKEIMGKYFPLIEHEQLEDEVKVMLNKRRRRFNVDVYQSEKGELNIARLNLEGFLKKSKKKYEFLETMKDDIKIYTAEYIMPYYKEWRNNCYDYAHAELITDLYVYSSKHDKIIGYIEAREGIVNFSEYFKDAFIGFISTEEDFGHLGIGTFMLRTTGSL